MRGRPKPEQGMVDFGSRSMGKLPLLYWDNDRETDQLRKEVARGHHTGHIKLPHGRRVWQCNAAVRLKLLA